MTRYIISFPEGAMDFPEDDLPAVADATHAVVFDAQAAGVWVTGGGLRDHGEGSVVSTDGAVTASMHRPGDGCLGGFCILDVPSRDDALSWAARFATSCRCAQEVRELLADPDV